MEAALLEKFNWFFQRVNNDPTAAAILTLASVVAPQPKRTGLTTKEAADYLGVSAKTVKRLQSEGKLRPQHIGKLVRFNADDLDAVNHTRQQPAKHSHHLRHFA